MVGGNREPALPAANAALSFFLIAPLPVRNSYRLDLVPVPLEHLAVADRHVQAPAVLPCREDEQASSSGRASVVDL